VTPDGYAITTIQSILSAATRCDYTRQGAKAAAVHDLPTIGVVSERGTAGPVIRAMDDAIAGHPDNLSSSTTTIGLRHSFPQYERLRHRSAAKHLMIARPPHRNRSSTQTWPRPSNHQPICLAQRASRICRCARRRRACRVRFLAAIGDPTHWSERTGRQSSPSTRDVHRRLGPPCLATQERPSGGPATRVRLPVKSSHPRQRLHLPHTYDTKGEILKLIEKPGSPRPRLTDRERANAIIHQLSRPTR